MIENKYLKKSLKSSSEILKISEEAEEFIKELEERNRGDYITVATTNQFSYSKNRLFEFRIKAINQLEEGRDPKLVRQELVEKTNDLLGIRIKTDNN